ncbi:hypothetical protein CAUPRSCDRAFT_11495 [Caulochytrium protostelioides]|uniref:Uncharacterized protein n=1 Tax=Caulochytrium protostelioides TaxID=1555241 RepID=A0A4P9WU43_9FUNG|nr:hypothetical protein CAUPRSCDRAFT_11495 [Caulochytrium protostelioides]
MFLATFSSSPFLLFTLFSSLTLIVRLSYLDLKPALASHARLSKPKTLAEAQEVAITVDEAIFSGTFLAHVGSPRHFTPSNVHQRPGPPQFSRPFMPSSSMQHPPPPPSSSPTPLELNAINAGHPPRC